MKKLFTLISFAIAYAANAQLVSDFENITLSAGTYKNGSGASVHSSFASGKVSLPNTYATQYGGFWSDGWAYSNIKNDTVGGYNNLYASYAASGNQNSANYIIGQSGGTVFITGADAGDTVKGCYVTNGTYAALSMKNGDMFTKKFGGASGNDSDFFILTIKAWKNGVLKNDSVNHYLADYRFANNAQDYIQKNWVWVNLSSLGMVDSLVFSLSSSDNGQFGMNTPAFFCVDDIITKTDTADFENLTLGTGKFWNKGNATLQTTYQSGAGSFLSQYTVSSFGDYWSKGFAISSVQDSTTAGYGNLYAAYALGGADSSSNYAIVQNRSGVKLTGALPEALYAEGVYVTNSTYAALSMKNGDSFAKKFGGATGNDSDYFRVTAKGYLNGTPKTDSVVFYLADYRFADNSKDYIVNDWQWMNLTPLGLIDSIQFVLSSSDNGSFGMNTPGFFAIDNLTVKYYTSLASVNQQKWQVNMYPNPATDKITIDFASSSALAYRLINLQGVTVKSGQLSSGESLLVDQLPAGIYLLQLTENETTQTLKLIKH